MNRVKSIQAGAVIVLLAATFFLIVTPRYGPQGYQPAAPDIDWARAAEVEARGDWMEISWLGGTSPGGVPGGYIEEELSRIFKIRFRPIFLSSDGYDRRKPLMMMGGQVPDVLREYDPTVLQRDAYHGFLLPVPYEVILKHAPTYVTYVNEMGPVSWLYAHWNGENYGLPTTYYGGLFPVAGVWRGDWLQKVGIEKVPETLEEMHEAFRRFRFNDPDGNGEQDTYGMTADLTRWWWASCGEIFGAYGVTPYDWMLRDGVAVWGGLLPETREALGLLRDWYEEGLIHPDAGTDSYDNNQGGMQRKFLNGQVGYWYYRSTFTAFRTDLPSTLRSRLKALDPKAELWPGGLPKGPEGKRGGRVWGGGGHTICFGRQLEDAPEKVIRVLRMLERICRNAPEDKTEDGELYVRSKIGRRGTHWDFTDQKRTPYAVWSFLGKYQDSNARNRELLGSLDSSCFCPGVSVAEIMDRFITTDELAFRKTHRPRELALTDLLGKPDVVPSAGSRMKDLRNMQMTFFAEIILGKRPLEDVEQFKTRWFEEGGEQMTREANALLKVKQQIYARVGVTEQHPPATDVQQ